MAVARNLTATTEADLLQLIIDRAEEGARLEFKRDLPGRDKDSAKEFCADVSAFANSGGGDIIYGIQEAATGEAGRLTPAQGDGPDSEKLRLLNVLSDNLEPRIPGLLIHTVAVQEGFVLILRVPQSWEAPHRVTPSRRFFIRENGRKRELNVAEIRRLFAQSESQAEKIRDFRLQRIGPLVSGAGPVRLIAGALFVVHLAPTQTVLGLASIDPIQYVDSRILPVLGVSSINSRVNLDGALATRSQCQEGKTHGYSLFFRNGFFESVKVLTGHLPGTGYEDSLIELVTKVRGELAHFGHGTELTVLVSLLNVEETSFGNERRAFREDDHQGRFDRPTVMLPDVLVPSDVSPEVALRPLFDVTWQAAGFKGSPRVPLRT